MPSRTLYRPDSSAAVVAHLPPHEVQRGRGFSLGLSRWHLPSLLGCLLLIVCLHVSFASTIDQGDASTGTRSVPPVLKLQGDAPNSSICRHALRQVNNHVGKCKIAREFAGCRFDSGFIAYLELQYCQFPSPAVPTILMVFWLLALLGAFAVIADSFFSPSLIALARSMRMSQNLAGVTLLAFGNGAPDVFSAITAITTGDPKAPDEGLGLGFLMGSGLLVNTVTAGLIMIIKPFSTTRRPFIKDTLFYMSAVCWSAVILVRRVIYLSDSVGFICLYLLYVCTTWAAGRIHVKTSKSPVYLRCAAFLHRLKQRITCRCRGIELPPRNASSTAQAVDSAKLSRSGDITLSGCFQDCLRCLRGRELSTATDLERHDGSLHKWEEVRIVNFRKRSDPMSLFKPTKQNVARRPPLMFPRIEVTSPPPDDSTMTTTHNSAKTPTFRTTNLHQLDPARNLPHKSRHDLLEPPSSVALNAGRHLTPPYNSPQRSRTNTPSYNQSRRNSAMGGYPGSSASRKRSVTGSGGMRSRTHSMKTRRGSRRMSTMEQLPFVVRWIIANEEAEGKGCCDGTNAGSKDERPRESQPCRKALKHQINNYAEGGHSGSLGVTDPSQCAPPTHQLGGAPGITAVTILGRDSLVASADHTRIRQATDSTNTLDIWSLPTFTVDPQHPIRSPTVSFLEDRLSHDTHSHTSNTNNPPPPPPPSGGHHRHHPLGLTSRAHRLSRISSVSLPDLENYGGGIGVQFDASIDADSRISMEDTTAHNPDQPEDNLDEFEKGVEGDDREYGEEEEVPDRFVQWASRGMWHHLLYSLRPVDISEWHELTTPVKLLQIIQAPMFMLFRLTIPVVYEDFEQPTHEMPTESDLTEDGAESNLENATSGHTTIFASPLSQPAEQNGGANGDDNDDGGGGGGDENGNGNNTVAAGTEETRSYVDQPFVDFEDLHGWCRLLNCFQCLITPMLWVMLITVGGTPLGLYKVGGSNLPVVVIVLLISTGLAIAIFVTSRWDRAPVPYHRPFFATLGFLTSIVWIYAIAHELVNSLEALGIVWEISETILGVTAMAFASSVGDLMSNSLVAHNGYPRIAFAACIGSPLFNLLIGAGASYTIKLARSGDHTASMSFSLTHALLFSFLMGVLTITLITAVVCGFRMRRGYGIFLLVAYGIFLVLAILIEADVIVEPYWWNMVTRTE